MDGTADDVPFADRVRLLDGPDAARALYDAWAPTYDDEHDPGDYLLPGLVADRVAALVAPDTDVLDAACGTGLVGQALAARAFTSIDGLDLSPAMVRRARRRRVYHDVGPADLARRLPGASDKFGVVTCVEGLRRGHLPPTALGEFARVVRPGGAVVVTVADEDGPDLAACLDRLDRHGTARVVTSTGHAGRADGSAPRRLLVLEVLLASAADGP